MADVIVKKYILEITIYPNGSEYQKFYPIGQTKKEYNIQNKCVKLSDSKVSKEEEL